MRTSILALALMVSACVTENELEPFPAPGDHQVAEGCLTLRPNAVQFDPVRVGEHELQASVVTVGNGCEGDLEIHDLSLVDAQAPFDIGAIGEVFLLPGESTDVLVTFDPTEDYRGLTRLLVQSSAGTAAVLLSGVGAAPSLEASLEVEVGLAPVGCLTEVPLSLANAGSETLDVHDLTLEATSDEYMLLDGDLPLDGAWSGELAPGERRELTLAYAPMDLVEDVAWVRITSNDPVDQEVVLVSSGASSDERMFSERFEVPLKAKVDVLWTLDRSG